MAVASNSIGVCSTGWVHTITLANDGKVSSFGGNKYGALGLGHNNNVSLPNTIPNLPRIKYVSCGHLFSVCIDTKGFMWSFGQNNYGQLGTGNTIHYNIPQKIQDIPPIQSIICGRYHTLIITNDSNLWSCGRNDHGQLCLENQINQSKPQQTSFTNIKKISSGYHHSIFQNKKGVMYGCGHNSNGEIGLGHFNHPQIKPTRIPIFDHVDIVQFTCGHHQSLFLDREGKVYSTGNNQFGSLGLGHYRNQNILNQIPNIPPIQSIYCVSCSCYLIDFDKNIWSFGFNYHGQLGHGDYINKLIPTKIQDLKNIKEISSGCCGYHCLVKDFQNKIFVMGRNQNGQLINTKSYSIPKEIDPEYFNIWGDLNWKKKEIQNLFYSEKTMNWNIDEINKLNLLQTLFNFRLFSFRKEVFFHFYFIYIL